MTTAHALATALLLGLLGSGGAWAQTAQTGTGGSALTTTRAGNTSAVGQTKPPGRAAAPDRSSDPQRDLVKREKAGVAEQGICIGCSAK